MVDEILRELFGEVVFGRLRQVAPITASLPAVPWLDREQARCRGAFKTR